ncbi:hypothetical protein M2480_002139 [Parabacteroides sp. PFB2-12]|nr:hypothetical protein [Parabacteroides sp. PM6-13]MDH6391149.1 hypothetical protein [Parabacteroides sp. PFB2-12]
MKQGGATCENVSEGRYSYYYSFSNLRNKYALFIWKSATTWGYFPFYQEKIQQLFEKAIQDDLEERAKGFPRLFVAQPGNSSFKEITIIKEDTVITCLQILEYVKEKGERRKGRLQIL